MRVALVTGGDRGIGQAISMSLAQAGAAVCITFKDREDLASGVVEAIRAAGGDASAWRLDLEDSEAIVRTIGDIQEQAGKIDILINNAGIAQEKPLEQISVADWDRMLDINLRGSFLCAQSLLPSMVAAGWGRIVNIASLGGQWGGWRQVHYGAAKAGLINLTRSLARVAGPAGVTVNAVSPGLIETDMTRQELQSDDGMDKLKSIPLGRIGTPEDVANAVKFLVSDDAAYITGQVINVNGGLYFE